MTDEQMFDKLLKKYFIPSWYDKETVEGMLDREISDEQWETFLDAEGGSLREAADRIFEEFIYDYVRDMVDEYFGGE